MGRQRKEYVATNLKTNKQIKGYSIDFEKMFNLSHSDFEKHLKHELIYRGEWVFEPAYRDQKINTDPDKVTFNDWKDWDRITSPFKLAIRREKTKENRRRNFRKRTLRTPYTTQKI